MIDEWAMTETFELRFEPTHHAASMARGQLRDHLKARGVPDRLVADLELVAAELLSNAVDQQPDRPVELLASVDDSAVHLTVSNSHGDGATESLPSLTAEAATAPDHDLLSERGRGLAIVHALVDGMWVHGDHTFTSVSLVLHRR